MKKTHRIVTITFRLRAKWVYHGVFPSLCLLPPSTSYFPFVTFTSRAPIACWKSVPFWFIQKSSEKKTRKTNKFASFSISIRRSDSIKRPLRADFILKSEKFYIKKYWWIKANPVYFPWINFVSHHF